MSQAVPAALPRDDTSRLGRALFYVQQQAMVSASDVVKAKLGTLIAAGKAMDLAVRLHGNRALNADLVEQFAMLAGISTLELHAVHLPMLKQADVIDYNMGPDGRVVGVTDFVGITAPLLRQALSVLTTMNPRPVERAVLHCVEIASWAPLTQSQHLDQLARRGYSDEVSDEALKITIALGINKRVHSAALREDVVFNPNVWASSQEDIAKFLRGLPPGERDALLGMCQQAAARPGLALPAYSGFDPNVMTSAKKVGLIQAATVKSTAPGAVGAQTYLFSPVLEMVDDAYQTTEALHQRKLFVAHILYGVEKAQRQGGRIMSPLRLVEVLSERGFVGPASNISTDYHLLEARNIVHVRRQPGGRAYLDAVKKEVIEGGLAWLEAAAGAPVDAVSDAEQVLGNLRPPQTFASPEAERTALGDAGASDEITTSAVLELRALKEDAQRVVRFDFS